MGLLLMLVMRPMVGRGGLAVDTYL